jgi:hypothetical protein
MSSNFLSNTLNIENKKYSNKPDIYDIKKNILKKNKINANQPKKYINNNFEKTTMFSQDKKNLINLENSYKDSLLLLDMIETQTEKNIYKKYKIQKNIINNNSSKDIQNILMKKKFLTIPL